MINRMRRGLGNIKVGSLQTMWGSWGCPSVSDGFPHLQHVCLHHSCLPSGSACPAWRGFRPEGGLPSTSPPITSVCECSDCAVSCYKLHQLHSQLVGTCRAAVCWGVYGQSGPGPAGEGEGWDSPLAFLFLSRCFLRACLCLKAAAAFTLLPIVSV